MEDQAWIATTWGLICFHVSSEELHGYNRVGVHLGGKLVHCLASSSSSLSGKFFLTYSSYTSQFFEWSAAWPLVSLA